MESSTPRTPAELAEEARQARDDAIAAAQGYAAESMAIGRSAAQSVRSNFQDATATGAQALDTAERMASDSMAIASEAVDTGRAYAQDAVDAAGKKIGTVRMDLQGLKEKSFQYIADEPVRSVLYAAVGSALLTALVLAIGRGRRY
jgi:hypothetical protein